MPQIQRTKTYLLSSVTEAADGCLYAHTDDGRIQLGTRQQIAGRLREPESVPNMHEVFRWLIRLARQTDANLSDLSIFDNRSVKLTLTIETVAQ